MENFQGSTIIRLHKTVPPGLRKRGKRRKKERKKKIEKGKMDFQLGLDLGLYSNLCPMFVDIVSI